MGLRIHYVNPGVQPLLLCFSLSLNVLCSHMKNSKPVRPLIVWHHSPGYFLDARGFLKLKEFVEVKNPHWNFWLGNNRTADEEPQRCDREVLRGLVAAATARTPVAARVWFPHKGGVSRVRCTAPDGARRRVGKNKCGRQSDPIDFGGQIRQRWSEACLPRSTVASQSD